MFNLIFCDKMHLLTISINFVFTNKTTILSLMDRCGFLAPKRRIIFTDITDFFKRFKKSYLY
ncbi:hypothetical protein BpHYR1_011218 [Brachionus plicatilis]|uniref:Uncharacterized protein n=1 Tax=Brachionus plicatilis TaxID=10195 RepID=A0A3M7SNK7_BRAPC|nr:hypothetical protein BpHYR1_011218 [Brachionus plicatilis]